MHRGGIAVTISFDGIKRFFGRRSVRIILILLFALALLLACYRVFFKKSGTAEGFKLTSEETRLAALLSKVEGAGKVTVMITEEDGKAVSAVVIFEGSDGLIVRMRLNEIAASALNLPKSAVLVYAA